MKKFLLIGVALIALLALTGTAGAVTCTIDQHPGATLLVPWFQVSVDSDGNVIGTGPGARDTLVTIGNASSAPMIAHVNVFNERSELVLDFNIALTSFDVQSFAMSSIITGILPQTGYIDSTTGALKDACQRNSSAKTYSQSPDGTGFIRFRPPNSSTSDPNDNFLATTLYPVPAWSHSSAFYFQVLDSLDDTFDTNTCPDFDGVDGIISGLEHGYLVIDHANYCNLSNPSQRAYYSNDAIGMENNLWGDIIFTSGAGLPTYAMSTVNLETHSVFELEDGDDARVRTFYARYWLPSTESLFNTNNCQGADPITNLCLAAPWDVGFGDLREPLGLNYAARWFDTTAPTITTNFRVWRAGFGIDDTTGRADLLGPTTSTGPKCTITEPVVTLSFYDEDENTVTQGVCPSPCSSPTFNFPLETQQTNISDFSHPQAPAGWVSMDFVNSSGTTMDQAWADYSFEGSAAFLSILVPGTQLDISTCDPLGVVNPQNPTPENPESLIDLPPLIPDRPVGTGPDWDYLPIPFFGGYL
jgi:hypothetical protein